jgi:AcrR family transcriptional regulator
MDNNLGDFNSNRIDFSPDSERTERRDAAENRQRILQVAKELFAEHGVGNVHMAQIAEAAGVGKGTLYRRFANKAELCLALVHDQLVEHQEVILGELRRMQLEKKSYVERVKVFLVEVADFTESHSALLSEAQRSDLDMRLHGDAPFFSWQHMTVTGLLRAAMNAGELPPDLDLPITVDLLLAPLTASYFRYLRNHQGYSTQQIGQALCDQVDRLVGGKR